MAIAGFIKPLKSLACTSGEYHTLNIPDHKNNIDFPPFLSKPVFALYNFIANFQF